jgi:hypothetical protein
MESDRNRAITNLKLRILVHESEMNRLQGIIAFSQYPARKTKATNDLAA